jgi:hypothetical protein
MSTTNQPAEPEQIDLKAEYDRGFGAVLLGSTELHEKGLEAVASHVSAPLITALGERDKRIEELTVDVRLRDMARNADKREITLLSSQLKQAKSDALKAWQNGFDEAILQLKQIDPPK